MMLIITLLIHVSCKELVYFVQVARHGARSPSGYMEWDENRWFDGESVLSADGMRQHYLIGQHLRRRYVDSGFLSLEFNMTQVKLVANEVERTQRSLLSQMLGFYPTRSWKKPLLKNPPVPIKLKNSTKISEDFQIPGFYMKVSPGNTMLRAKDGCPEYKQFTKKRKNKTTILRSPNRHKIAQFHVCKNIYNVNSTFYFKFKITETASLYLLKAIKNLSYNFDSSLIYSKKIRLSLVSSINFN